ncbi:hypothetical protein FOL47_002401, partial [Perkinsus chesapeaki]
MSFGGVPPGIGADGSRVSIINSSQTGKPTRASLRRGTTGLNHGSTESGSFRHSSPSLKQPPPAQPLEGSASPCRRSSGSTRSTVTSDFQRRKRSSVTTASSRPSSRCSSSPKLPEAPVKKTRKTLSDSDFPILISDSPEKPCSRQSENCSPGRKLDLSRFEVVVVKARAKSSEVWKSGRFGRVKAIGEDDADILSCTAVCTVCLQVFSTKGSSTTTLLRHMDSCDGPDDCKQPTLLSYFSHKALTKQQRDQLTSSLVETIAAVPGLGFQSVTNARFIEMIQTVSNLTARVGGPVQAHREVLLDGWRNPFTHGEILGVTTVVVKDGVPTSVAIALRDLPSGKSEDLYEALKN